MPSSEASFRKARSYSSRVTRVDSTTKSIPNFLQFTINQVHSMNNPFTPQQSAKFTKRFVHTQTEMNSMVETEQKARRFCMRPIQRGHRVTMYESQPKRNIFKYGDCSYLALESPQNRIIPCKYEDIGTVNNRKSYPIPSHYKSTTTLDYHPELTPIPQRSIRRNNQTHRNKMDTVKSQLEWKAKNVTNRQRFNQKYRNLDKLQKSKASEKEKTYGMLHKVRSGKIGKI